MGTSGVPWDGSKIEIIEALKKRKGRLTYVARDLGVHYITLKKRIDSDPDLTQLTSDLRNHFDRVLVDSGEDVLLFAMGSRETDLSSALKAAFYILDRKGKILGYVHPRVSDGQIETNDIREVAQAFAELDSQIPSISISGECGMEAESSLFYQERGREEGSLPDELGPKDPVGGDA